MGLDCFVNDHWICIMKCNRDKYATNKTSGRGQILFDCTASSAAKWQNHSSLQLQVTLPATASIAVVKTVSMWTHDCSVATQTYQQHFRGIITRNCTLSHTLSSDKIKMSLIPMVAMHTPWCGCEMKGFGFSSSLVAQFDEVKLCKCRWERYSLEWPVKVQ